jgi:hypothetical protein
MISFDLKKLFGNFRQKNKYKNVNIITAERDWKVLLIISIAVAFFVAIGNMSLFSRINDESIFQERIVPATPVITIDMIRLGKVIETFEEKARHFDELSRKAPREADPSVILAR